MFDFNDVALKIKSETWRHYHSWDNHIKPMLEEVEKNFSNSKYFQDYLVATLYHDCVYDPLANDNEVKSLDFFEKYATINKLGIEFNYENVRKLILATINHESDDPFIIDFLKLDLGSFFKEPIEIYNDSLLVRKEYKFVDFNLFKEKRKLILDKFLEKDYLPEHAKNSLKASIKIFDNHHPKFGLYAGSFNPFHIGHYDIIQQSENVFDEVIILKALNPTKEKSKLEIPEKLKYYQIKEYDGPIVDYISNSPYNLTLVRGLRNNTDFQEELEYQRVLNDLGKISVVNFFAKAEHVHISSKTARTLQKVYGDIEKAKIYNL